MFRRPGRGPRSRGLLGWRLLDEKQHRCFARESSGPSRDTAWAMSEENVELLHQGVAAWKRRDLDGYLELADPEIEWYSGATRVEGGAFWSRGGYEEVLDRHLRCLRRTRDEHRRGPRDRRHGRQGSAVVRGRSKGGVRIDTQYGLVLRYRVGLLVSGSDWFSHTEALVAAGLSE